MHWGGAQLRGVGRLASLCGKAGPDRVRASAGVVAALAIGLGAGLFIGSASAAGPAPRAQDPVPKRGLPQSPPPGSVPPEFDLNSINGRDFAGLRLPLAPVAGPISFKASRAWTWNEDERPSFAGAVDMPVHRLLLDGDVRIRLGIYEFASRRAVVWVQHVEGAPDGANVQQVFLYLERAETPDADAATSVSSDRLPVRAVIDLKGSMELTADLTTPGRPNNPLIAEGESALSRSLHSWITPPEEEEPRPAPGPAEPPPPGALKELAQAQVFDPIFAKSGILTLSPGSITLVSGTEENSVIATGGIVVQYTDLGKNKNLRLSAQRAVIFLPPGPLADFARLDAKKVRGIYLEGDVVATDGKYTLRGPRVYYDVQHNKAMVVDAVFWTYEAHRGLPLYLRAESIRQQSEGEFVATRARLTSAAFFDPELSLGSSSITIRRVPRDPDAGAARPGSKSGAPGGPIEAGITARGMFDGPEAPSGELRNIVTTDDITLRAGGLPFFYWPQFEGDPEDVPLRDVRIENSSGSGTAIKTTWNAYGLVGARRRSWLDADVMIDAYFERGIALGSKLNWRDVDRRGSAFAYLVPYDTGTDVLPPGTKIERDGETRGIVYGEQIEKIDEHWKLFLEGSYISDESFADAFFEDQARSRREFTNRADLRYRGANSFFSIEAKGNANDFIANQYLLQTPGYVTARTPEATYLRLFDDPIGGAEPGDPGPILWTQEYRVGRLELQFDEPKADERGFTYDAISQRAFGIGHTQAIAERLRSQGYIEDGIFRADTRQELDMPMQVGVLNVTPFAVGRATVWDNDFTAYSPGEEDNTRLWYGAGARVSTTMQRVDDSVDSRLFDLHRMRHVVTPYGTVWQSGTNVDRADLPVYDEDVEGIAEGGIASFGVDQTWQTQRGKAGHWHSVDVFKLNIAYTDSSRDSDRESPIGRFVDYRPELSNVGNFFTADGVWQVSDALALTGSSVYDTGSGQQSRSSIGAIVQHYPDFSSFIELRSLNAQDSTHLDFGQAYKLSQKYRVAWVGSYETTQGDFSDIGFEVQRSFPTADFGFGISYNNISSETSFGFVFRPAGAKGRGARLQGLGSSDPRKQSEGL